MRLTSALIGTIALSISACGFSSVPRSSGPPAEWRGQTYTVCQEKVALAKEIEAEGVPDVGPVTGAARNRLIQYITVTEHLSFAEFCGRGGNSLGGFLGAVSASIPEDVEAQGDSAIDLYQDMRSAGHSPEFIRAYIDDGKFEEHMRLRRLM